MCAWCRYTRRRFESTHGGFLCVPSRAIHHKNHPPTGYEPNFLDFQYTETNDMTFQEESVDKEADPSYSCGAELDDETIGKGLSSPLSHEREEPANLRQAYHFNEESFEPTQSFFAHSRTVRPVHDLISLTSSTEKTKSRDGKRKNQDSLWKTKRANSR